MLTFAICAIGLVALLSFNVQVFPSSEVQNFFPDPYKLPTVTTALQSTLSFSLPHLLFVAKKKIKKKTILGPTVRSPCAKTYIIISIIIIIRKFLCLVDILFLIVEIDYAYLFTC